MTVCNAVQHAHQKGIIHRDLKPSNILITTLDGNPVAKVIDFGLAKAVNQEIRLAGKTLPTELGRFIGTALYASPEQAAGSPDIDTRTDIFSLGVLLYELLTGMTPIDVTAKLLDQLLPGNPRKRPPKTKSTVCCFEELSRVCIRSPNGTKNLQRLLQGELDLIVMKAIEKERDRRYHSASALADDLSRHLRNEPIEARPPSWQYMVRKLIQKHRVAACVISSFFLLTTISLFIITALYLRAQDRTQTTERVLGFLTEDLIQQVSPDKSRSPSVTVSRGYRRSIGKTA